MRYSCLIFDHDDTVVNSTASIHYPAFSAFLEKYYPGKSCTLENYFEKNFSPGFLEFCKQDYDMTDKDLEKEFEFWQAYIEGKIPAAFEGIKFIMERHRAAGGKIAVISHSIKSNILRDYNANGLPEPDLVFGWDEPPEHRKPNAWPVIQVLAKFGLEAKNVLMIDDLKPGYDMAKQAGIDFAAAGWANNIASIERFMRSNSQYYFKTVKELADFLN